MEREVLAYIKQNRMIGKNDVVLLKQATMTVYLENYKQQQYLGYGSNRKICSYCRWENWILH